MDQTGQPYSYAGDDAVNFEDPLGESLWGAIAHWYDRNKATIETLEVVGDVLALAALLTPEGWVTDAVEVTAGIVADTFAVMTCADSPRSDGCYEAIGSAALGALGVKFALGKSLTGDDRGWVVPSRRHTRGPSPRKGTRPQYVAVSVQWLGGDGERGERRGPCPERLHLRVGSVPLEQLASAPLGNLCQQLDSTK